MKTPPLLRSRFLSLMGATSLLSLSPHSVNATVALSSPAPDVNSILVNSAAPATSGNFLYGRSTGTNQYGGVVFQLSGPADVRAVTFFLNGFATNASEAEVSFSLVQFTTVPTPTSGATTDVAYTYTPVHTETMSLPKLITGTDEGKYITFSFEAPPSLSAGTYGAMLQFVTPAGSQNITFRNVSLEDPEAMNFRTTDTWANGVITGTTYQVSGVESYFAVTGAVAVPEPSVAWLFGAGLLFGCRAAWRRRAPAQERC